ncbi:MAG: ABC transporter permease [Polyangiaceae bacterium]|nr:ABC transporter permease [Polyangiaceae bacterium]MCE7889490.1 ABC transporter permease [Sorangiineae bacterium PRO1]MCL4750897.1 FtsX-like permease family protein [Myxococcales bacterium]
MIPLSYNVRNLAVRKATTVASAGGIALVVFVLASSLMLSEGLRRTLATSGKDDTVVVLRKGNNAELSSTIDDPTVGIVRSAPGVKAKSDGTPMSVAELMVVAFMETSDGKGRSNVQIRGVPSDVLDFRPEVRLLEGRPIKPGTDEVMVGKSISGRFKNLKLGDSFELRKNRPVKVVGVYEAGGSAFESEAWVDLDVLREAFGRRGVVSTVRVKLDSPSRFEGFETAIESDKRLGLDAVPEREFYEKQSEGTTLFITVMGVLIAVFFSVGAMIGATITMYAAVANRKREVGVLRALGFSRLMIVASFLFESVLIALIGGGIGALASLAMGFVSFSMMNFSTWSEIVFRFTPTPEIIGTSLLFGGVMGVLGGFFPALRAAAVSPVEAMRE